VSSSQAPKKRSQDKPNKGASGQEAQRNATNENSTAKGHSPASLEEYMGSLYAIRSNLWKFFELIAHSPALIDEAFAGQPFLRDLPADAPANRRRFNTFLDQHRQVSKLLFDALELWRRSFGITMRQSKPPAKKRTGKGGTRKS
jgi:hypothetical protein